MRIGNLLVCVAAGVCVTGGIVHFLAATKNPAGLRTLPDNGQLPGQMAAQHASVAFSSQTAISISPTDPQTLAKQILALDPQDNDGRYAALLDGLCRAGDFQLALKLAGQAPPDLQSSLLKIIFNRFAQSRPSDALKSLDAIADPQLHSAALRATVDGWDSTRLNDLATYAFALPPCDDRDYALGTALDRWSLQDPDALSAWLNTLPRGDEFDYGATLMIEKTDGANRPPELAMEWVQSIADPALKQNLLLRVLDEWSQSDSAAARQYIASADWLDDSQRQQALEHISNATVQ